MSSTAASESQHAVSLEDLPPPPPPPLRGPGQRVQNSGLSAPSSTPARSCDRPSTPRSLFVADRSDSVTDTSSEPVAADLSPDAVTSEPKAQSVTPITPTSTRIIAPTSAESLPAKEEVTKKKGRRKGTGRLARFIGAKKIQRCYLRYTGPINIRKCSWEARSPIR